MRCLAFLGILLFGSAKAAELPTRFADDLSGAISVVDAIFKLAPPNKNTYIAIGRSPTLIHAAFLAVGPLSIQIPISGLSKHYQLWAQDREKWKKRNRSIFDHFDKHLPTPNQLRGKDILIYDIMQEVSGTLPMMCYLIKWYYLQRHRTNVNIFGLDFDATKFERLPLLFEEIRIEQISLGGKTLGAFLLKYNNFAEVGQMKFADSDDYIEYSKGENFNKLLESVRKKLQDKNFEIHLSYRVRNRNIKNALVWDKSLATDQKIKLNKWMGNLFPSYCWKLFQFLSRVF